MSDPTKEDRMMQYLPHLARYWRSRICAYPRASALPELSMQCALCVSVHDTFYVIAAHMRRGIHQFPAFPLQRPPVRVRVRRADISNAPRPALMLGSTLKTLHVDNLAAASVDVLQRINPRRVAVDPFGTLELQVSSESRPLLSKLKLFLQRAHVECILGPRQFF